MKTKKMESLEGKHALALSMANAPFEKSQQSAHSYNFDTIGAEVLTSEDARRVTGCATYTDGGLHVCS